MDLADNTRRLVWSAATILALGCSRHSPLLAPTLKDLAWVAPDSFETVFETSRGDFSITAHRAWSPLGVDRFHFLVRNGYYDGARFFRVVPGFVVQWGISGESAVNAVWDDRSVPDEPVQQSNLRGRVSYARGGPNTRGVQLYVNLADNPRLDTLNSFGFPPIGEVRAGMAAVDSMYPGYSCQRGSQGTCPSQDSVGTVGNSYLRRVFPKLDSIRRARVVREWKGHRPG
jgi:peptidyl-prolyl cis-trans isomerase A (cyclophilin A)